MMGLFVVSSHSVVLWGPSCVCSIHSFFKWKTSFFISLCLPLLPIFLPHRPSGSHSTKEKYRGLRTETWSSTSSPGNTLLNLLLPTFQPQLSPPAHFFLLYKGLQSPLGNVGGSRGSPTFLVLQTHIHTCTPAVTETHTLSVQSWWRV